MSGTSVPFLARLSAGSRVKSGEPARIGIALHLTNMSSHVKSASDRMGTISMEPCFSLELRPKAGLLCEFSRPHEWLVPVTRLGVA